MMSLPTSIIITVEKTDSGFSAFANEYPVFTTGTTVPELINNTYEAVSLYFEEEGIQVDSSIIKFEIDFRQFFKHYKVLNAKFLAEKIGMNPTLLSQYVQGHKKPSPKQAEKILNGIHQIGLELTGITLLPTG